mgnify:CR=1 FL=1
MTVFVLGSINLDAVARVEDLPRPGETVAGLSLELFPGGKGANQAVAAARMGAPTRLMGAVGRDDSGPSLKTKLAGYGVQVADVLCTHRTQRQGLGCRRQWLEPHLKPVTQARPQVRASRAWASGSRA